MFFKRIVVILLILMLIYMLFSLFRMNIDKNILIYIENNLTRFWIIIRVSNITKSDITYIGQEV
jgi:hypothetical protein